MENVLFFSENVLPAQTQAQQLKVIMKLPVRLISDNKIMDVVPLPPQVKKIRRVQSFTGEGEPFAYPSLNDLILFFQGCEVDGLVEAKDLVKIYQVSKSTIKDWARSKTLKAYRLNQVLTVYKKSELPTMEQLYGPFEL